MTPRTLRPWMLLGAVAALAWPEEARVSPEPITGQLHSEYKPGYLTDLVVPGDPVQTLEVAGFADAADALRFAAGGLRGSAPSAPGAAPASAWPDLPGGRPVFRATLRRGDSVALGKATHLVFFYLGEDGAPALLAVLRCHADLHLLVGFCGYQLQLSANLPAPPAPPVQHGLLR